eukprot:jgi/Undpi1/1504/HiC_scaffold_11.g04894.m1
MDREVCLPADSGDPVARAEELIQQQQIYDWSTDGIFGDVPFLAGTLPDAEETGLLWKTKVVESLVDLIAGTIRHKHHSLRDLVGQGICCAESLDDYNRLHSYPMETPDSVYDFQDDDAFARDRLQGGNCITIQKCSETTYNKLGLSLAQEEYTARAGELKTKVDSLYAAGHLFVVDHELLAGKTTASVDGYQKFLAPCVAMFEYVQEDQGLLPIKAIGIQLNQGEVASPIFMPTDGDNWEIAKACFRAADSIIHEVISHLAYTHIVLEGPMVSINRQLSPDHPINKLLRAHLQGTAAINLGAQNRLLVEGGAVDRIHAIPVGEAAGLCNQETLKRISEDFSPAVDFTKRGMDKENFPGLYMYREVGTQLYDAIFDWVEAYLNVYYRPESITAGADSVMESDVELQAFVTEMASAEGGPMGWFSEYEGSSDKRGLIAKILSTFIYTASTLHAAVNFPQQYSMSYVPSCPASIYQEPPADKAERTNEELLAYLPPMTVATTQVSAMTLLGSVYHTKLGDYPPFYFNDRKVNRALRTFQKAIETIETNLIVKNAQIVNSWKLKSKSDHVAKNFAYKTLMPDNIPQSINI